MLNPKAHRPHSHFSLSRFSLIHDRLCSVTTEQGCNPGAAMKMRLVSTFVKNLAQETEID